MKHKTSHNKATAAAKRNTGLLGTAARGLGSRQSRIEQALNRAAGAPTKMNTVRKPAR